MQFPLNADPDPGYVLQNLDPDTAHVYTFLQGLTISLKPRIFEFYMFSLNLELLFRIRFIVSH